MLLILICYIKEKYLFIISYLKKKNFLFLQ